MDSSDQKKQTHCSSALKFLLVDDDLQVLKSLEDNLKTCGCNVITCTSAQDAVDLINEKKHEVDLVLCDLTMASTKGFEFLKHVCLRVPVFVMCMQEDSSGMMKVLREDACGCILKSSSLRKLHQHVLKRRSKKVDDPNNAADSRKKQRLIWYDKLHEKFVEEVKKIGLDKVTPKKLLEAMNVPGLTSVHISSHLQRYRINLIRAQGESDQQKNVQKRLAVHADFAIQEPAIMVPAQNHYNAGIVAMIGVDTADQNPHDVPICHVCAVPPQMLKQNNDLYAGETTQDRNGLVQNQSTDLYARPQSKVSEFNDDEVQGKNGLDNPFKESGDDSSALNLSDFPTWDDVDFSLFDLDNQELTAETQAPFGSSNQFDDAYNL